MWQLDNRTPYAAARSFTRNRDGGVASGIDPSEADREGRNQVGVGFGLREEFAENAPLANIHWAQTPNPAGFGAIPRHWRPRLVYGGRDDESWERERKPWLPFDFDERYWQCAPADQQVAGFLRRGENLEVVGMHESGPLQLTLPHHQFELTTALGDRTIAHEAHLHTLCLDLDRDRLFLVWHARLPCPNRAHQVGETRILVAGAQLR